MGDWSFVASGTLGSAPDLGMLSGAMRDRTSPDVSALQLVMTAPQGWPSWAAFATGASVSGNTLTWEWRLPWLGAGASSLDASPFSPATDALVQDTVMTSGPISWTLYEQTSGSLGALNSVPIVGTAAQNVNNASQDVVAHALDSLKKGEAPWGALAIGLGVYLLAREIL